MKIQYKLLQLFPLFLFYFPTLRVGGIPFRFEDLLCVTFFISALFFGTQGVKKKQASAWVAYWLMIAILTVSAIYYSSMLNIKSWIIGVSFAKYLLWYFVISKVSSSISRDGFRDGLVKVLKICFYLQFIILIFQKFNILGFASGVPFHFVVKFYSIPNIYATTTDIEALISTHMNFAFRPAGTFGSSTVTGISMYIVGSLISLYYGKVYYKLLGYLAAFICFSKIAIVAAIFCDFILPVIIKFRVRTFMISVASFPILLLAGYFLMDFLGVMHNLQGALDGTDRGVTHRLAVTEYMFDMHWFELFFGNLGPLPFGFFDSGTLLSIFRYGLLFYMLEYAVLYLMFFSFSKKKLYSVSLVALVFLQI
ncbi:hypothetical protein [Thaumasiovibrio subtropicus]|uniref:hypothetical protein n=1 Tax=Thaumasiovibrio subtropicus TaxID=1891207 RepID=UPI001C84696C|nr:hypothetical protein [Thaumasiovibrio subtropicus]